MAFSDQRIADLLAESKPEVDDQIALAQLSASPPKLSNRRWRKSFVGGAGTQFELILRQNALRALDFSVILAFVPESDEIILRRHNGRGHQHRNKIEGDRFRDAFHFHMATARYQEAGHPIDGYGETTDTFHDLSTALHAMLALANFALPPQLTLERDL